MTDASGRHSRQSFLGADSEEKIRTCMVGIVGLGGGGSHIVQQLGHLGFRRFALFDPDRVELSNLNRMVGTTLEDVRERVLKIEVARRLLKGLQDGPEISAWPCRWQSRPEVLRGCDIIFGCVDGFAERRELETCARRYLIPYIDIGLDVHIVGNEPPRMAGQVIVSMPGGPCMTCLGFLSDKALADEAGRYGEAGPSPQVVWANGVLASTAVGLALDLLTDWAGALRSSVYASYDGNLGTVSPHVRLQYADTTPCPHFPSQSVGDPVFEQL